MGKRLTSRTHGRRALVAAVPGPPFASARCRANHKVGSGDTSPSTTSPTNVRVDVLVLG
jgi:hypothetical protein